MDIRGRPTSFSESPRKAGRVTSSGARRRDRFSISSHAQRCQARSRSIDCSINVYSFRSRQLERPRNRGFLPARPRASNHRFFPSCRAALGLGQEPASEVVLVPTRHDEDDRSSRPQPRQQIGLPPIPMMGPGCSASARGGRRGRLFWGLSPNSRSPALGLVTRRKDYSLCKKSPASGWV